MKEIILFNNKEVRRSWYQNEWYYVIVDVIELLTTTKNPSGYLKDLRRRDAGLKEGWGQIATPLKFDTPGGKQSLNCTNKEGLLRLLQSIPSKNAEPFKLWLAKVGSQTLDEKINKRLAVRRKLKDTQNKLFDTVKERGIDQTNFKEIMEAGDDALFNKENLKAKFGISEDEELDDFLNTVLLSSKDLATSLTDYNVQEKDLRDKKNITGQHVEINKGVRSLIIDKTGKKPEEMPKEENINRLSSKNDSKKLD